MQAANPTESMSDFGSDLLDTLSFALETAKRSGADQASVVLGDH